MSKKKDTKGKPKVDPELEGFDIEINSFGEIKSNFDIGRINKFLNERVEDKKLRDRPEFRTGQKDSDPADSDEPDSTQ